MAALVTLKSGTREIRFRLSASERHRRSVRLGRCTLKQAEAFRGRVESLIADKLKGRPNDAELSAWLAALDESTLAKLRAVGLAEGVGLTRATLGEFCKRWADQLDAAEATRTFYAHTLRNLKAYFGEARAVATITAADADAWRSWLVSEEKLSAATVGRRVKAARTIWRAAVRWRLTTDNPFDGVRGGVQTNESRKQFVSRETIAQVLDATADPEWRVIIVLARYGGLRTPSETFELRWADINWERGTLLVRCPKLRHRGERFASRTLPLFPELRGPLLALFNSPEADGTEYVVNRLRKGSVNLRTGFERIIARAGVASWPRLFQNLRASRESELMREFDLATVCRWIGNSPGVAAQHYAVSVDLNADFARAAGIDAPPAETPNKGAPESAPKSAPDGGFTPSNGVDDDLQADAETPQNKGILAFSTRYAGSAEVDPWAHEDSNLGPRRYQRRALAN